MTLPLSYIPLLVSVCRINSPGAGLQQALQTGQGAGPHARRASHLRLTQTLIRATGPQEAIPRKTSQEPPRGFLLSRIVVGWVFLARGRCWAPALSSEGVHQICRLLCKSKEEAELGEQRVPVGLPAREEADQQG